jgi:phospho-N-acetylmuramoyl-pentapeptide-transferase
MGYFLDFMSLEGRAFGAGLMSFILMLLLGQPFIRFLKEKQLGQMIREVGPASHYSKKNTPTMGGILILFSILTSCLIWGNFTNPVLLLGLLVLISMGLIGGLDDGLKIFKKKNLGLRAKPKFLMLSGIAILVGALTWKLSPEGMIHIPFLNHFSENSHAGIAWGMWIILFYYFVLTGSANAVNLTDGQDGLVSFVVAVAAAVFLIFAISFHLHSIYSIHSTHPMHLISQISQISQKITQSNQIKFSQGIPGSEELAVFAAAIIGSCLGFLWFNSYPAQIFMGDVGSLALGGALGFMAMALKLELLYLLIGFVFVIEALSVILQVGYFKWTHGKRIFRMSPIHHHFELGGIPESKVTIRFWLVAILCALLSLWAL